MKQLPSVDKKKLVWPEPEPMTLIGIIRDGAFILIGIVAVLILYLVMTTRDLSNQLEDAKRSSHEAHGHLAALMNGRPLVDKEQMIAFIPEGKVVEVNIK